MIVNPKIIRENNDSDVCIYVRDVSERNFLYQSYWSFFAYHNGKMQLMWNNSNGFHDMPRDGDKCNICGREILIVDGVM